MSDLLIAVGLVFLFGVVPIVIGRMMKWADNPPPRRLHRRPNVRLVPRDRDEAA